MAVNKIGINLLVVHFTFLLVGVFELNSVDLRIMMD